MQNEIDCVVAYTNAVFDRYKESNDWAADINQMLLLISYLLEWMSEWLLSNPSAKWEIFQVYHGENKLHFNEVMMISALY